jgi:hypothetical protein
VENRVERRDSVLPTFEVSLPDEIDDIDVV